MANEINSKSCDVPVWNLDSIFPSIECEEYKAALSENNSLFENAEQLAETAENFTREQNGNFDFPLWLKTFLENYEKLTASIMTLGAYAYVIYSTDTTNTSYLNNLDSIEKLEIRLNDIEVKFTRILVSHQNQTDEFFTRFPEYSEYRFTINEFIENSKHMLSPAEEKLAAQLQQTGGNAWGNLQEQIISNLSDSEGKTFNELRNDAYDSDAETRKLSWEKEKALLEQNKIALAASLNNLKGETVTLNKKRGWKNALERSLFTSRLSEKTLAALTEVMKDALPVWRKYFKAKAAYLRKHGMTKSKTAGLNGNGLAFYDLFAPLSSGEKNSLLSKKWTFKEACDYVVEKYSSFSESMGKFARTAFDSGWVDAKIRRGKTGGAYDEDFPKGHQSRILTNFTGTFSDIITLAHEAGHAYHFNCMKGKSPLFFSYPMTLAETASTFAETIVKQDMIKNASGKDKLMILDLDLQDASQVLVDILCRFYFEQSVFENRENGILNAEDFCSLMKDAQEKTYGDGLNEERHEYMWAVKSHYYSTGFDFYNFPYAFGQLFAAALYEKSLEEGSAFAEKYAELLSNTGSMSCEDLCAKAGFDITKKDFWEKGIKLYKEEAELFVSLAQE